MNFRQLEAFRATMKTGSVSAAANAMYISQPSVSRLLKELEYSIGIQLFYHQKGKFNPTREAELLFEEVDRSFVGLETIKNVAGQISNLSMGRLRLGFPPALSVSLLPESVNRFANQYQQTSISVWARSSRRISDWVGSYQLDVGIVISHFDHPSISIIDKVKTNLVLVMPENHPLSRSETVTWDDIRNESLISIDQKYLLGQTHDSKLKKVLETQVRIETEICFTACSLVQYGLGIAIVDPFTASHFLDLGLVAREISAEIPYNFYIVHTKHRKPSLAVEKFLPILKQTIEDICGTI
jgi:DNA-binding transcriptional LysR family regulator